jgi:hypothetical protein
MSEKRVFLTNIFLQILRLSATWIGTGEVLKVQSTETSISDVPANLISFYSRGLLLPLRGIAMTVSFIWFGQIPLRNPITLQVIASPT